MACIHRFGASLNAHTHFSAVVIDGVFEPDSQQGVRFIAAEARDADTLREVQTQVRRRLLRAFVRRGRIDAQT
ncbi:transposase [Aquisalimonas sp.]|uniref:transposase n=1 Tax=Aquisalimonas sp. TaxID=1872621 RepID=UPI0025B9C5CE|nr:transposase [Aquisalimonas sp.]